MKRFVHWGVFLCLFLPSHFVYSDDSSGILTIHTARTEAATLLHYFGNQHIEIPIILSGKLGQFENIQAQLFQQSSSLEVPYGDPILLDMAEILPDSSEYKVQISLYLPAVKRETLFIFRFTANHLLKREQMKISEFPLILYSEEMMDAVKVWSQKVQLRLKDPTGRLTKLLETKKIKFQDFQSPVSGIPGEPIVNMVVVIPGDYFRKEDYIKPAQITVFFMEKTTGLPNILVKEDSDSRVLEVHMELIKNIDHNPQAQKTFLDIVQLSANKE